MKKALVLSIIFSIACSLPWALAASQAAKAAPNTPPRPSKRAHSAVLRSETTPPPSPEKKLGHPREQAKQEILSTDRAFVAAPLFNSTISLRTRLHEGALGNNLVRDDIATHVDKINAQDADGKTAFEYACQYRHWNALELLLQAGADPRADRNDMRNLFLGSLREGREAIALKLLEQERGKLFVHNIPEDGIFLYCGARFPEVLKQLLAHHAAMHPGDTTLLNYQCSKGISVLHAAVAASNDARAVEMLLKAGADPDTSTTDRITPLMSASSKKDCTHLKKLLAWARTNKGASEVLEFLNRQNKWGKTALHIACSNDNRDATLRLLAAGASRTIKDARGKTACEYLPSAPAVDMLRNINARDQQGSTPLYRAVADNNLGMTQTLLIRGADQSLTSRTGKTALMKACELQNTAILATLLAQLHTRSDYDPNNVVNQQTDGTLNSAMLYALITNPVNDGAIDLLLQHRYDCSLQNSCGLTPLMVEARKSNPSAERLQKLIDSLGHIRTQVVNTSDRSGKTALDCALLQYTVQQSNFPVIATLLNAGAITRDACSMLYIAMKHEAHDIVAHLLDSYIFTLEQEPTGAIHKTLDIRTFAHDARLWQRIIMRGVQLQFLTGTQDPIQQLLFVAVDAGNHTVAEWLLSHKYDPNERDTQGNTPLMRAIQKNDEQMVRLLLRGGITRNPADKTLESLFNELETTEQDRALAQKDPHHEYTPGSVESLKEGISDHLDAQGIRRHKVNPNLCNAEKQTILHLACKINSPAIVQLILKNTHYQEALNLAALLEPDTESMLPLDYAIKNNNNEIATLLLATPYKDEQLKARKTDGTLPLVAGTQALHRSIYSPELCALLLRHGADRKGQDDQGNTALHRALAQALEHEKTDGSSAQHLRDSAVLITDCGETLKIKNQEGTTPQDLAQQLHFEGPITQPGAKMLYGMQHNLPATSARATRKKKDRTIELNLSDSDDEGDQEESRDEQQRIALNRALAAHVSNEQVAPQTSVMNAKDSMSRAEESNKDLHSLGAQKPTRMQPLAATSQRPKPPQPPTSDARAIDPVVADTIRGTTRGDTQGAANVYSGKSTQSTASLSGCAAKKSVILPSETDSVATQRGSDLPYRPHDSQEIIQNILADGSPHQSNASATSQPLVASNFLNEQESEIFAGTSQASQASEEF